MSLIFILNTVFVEKSIVGFFKADYKLFKANSKNYLTRFRMSGSSFHYDSNYRYSVLIPSIGWSFRPKNIRDNKRQILQLAWYNVFRDKSPNVVTKSRLQYNKLTTCLCSKQYHRLFKRQKQY